MAIFNFPLQDGPLVHRQPVAARGMGSFLTSGPMMLAPERRREMLGRMADAIVANEAHGSRQDAIRLLHHLGFERMDVMLLAPEAFDMAREFVETQGMVADQMMDKPT